MLQRSASESAALRKGGAGKALQCEFDDWFQTLFREEDAAASAQNKPQAEKARRLSLGGTAGGLFLGGKIANGKVLRRQRSLPEQRRTFIRGENRDILEQESSQIEREAQEAQEAERRQREVIKQRTMEWNSERKLDVEADPVRDLARNPLGAAFEDGLHVRLALCGLSSDQDDLFELGPGARFAPLLVKSMSLSKSLAAAFVPCLVSGFAGPTAQRKSSTDGFYAVQLSRGGSATRLPAGYPISDLTKAVDAVVGDQHLSGYPVALAKRTHFRIERSDARGATLLESPLTSLVFLYTKEQVIQEFSRNAPGPVVIQRFVKSRGTRPWCVRAIWNAKAGCRKMYVLTSTSEFVTQSITAASKVGQVWSAKAPVGTNPGSSRKGGPAFERGTLHGLRGTCTRSLHVHQLATDTWSQGRCSVVPANPSMWAEPAALAQELGEALVRGTQLPFKDLAVDLVQDAAGDWHVLQVKSFRLEEKAHQLVRTVQRGPEAEEWRVLSPPVPPIKRAGSATAAKPPLPRERGRGSTQGGRCAGDFCDPAAEASGAKEELTPIRFRQILLERAAQRADQRSGSQTAKPRPDSELERWFTPVESKRQMDQAQVCASCLKVYWASEEARQRVKLQAERRKRQKDVRAERACLRLYDKFKQDERLKTLEIADMLHDERTEVSAAAAAAQKTRKKKKKTKPRRRRPRQLLQPRARREDGPPDRSAAAQSGGGGGGGEDDDGSSSVSSEASLLAGDSVVDNFLGNGTVVDTDTNGLLTVHFLDGQVQGGIARDRLRRGESRGAAAALRLSADELVGLGPLPPQLGPEEEPGLDLSARNPAGALSARPLSSRQATDNANAGLKFPPISKRFRNLFVQDDDHDDHAACDEAAASGGTAPAPELVLPRTSGVLCPFGCGARLEARAGASLSGSHAAWAAHAQHCVARRPAVGPAAAAVPDAASTAVPGVGISRVARQQPGPRALGASRHLLARP